MSPRKSRCPIKLKAFLFCLIASLTPQLHAMQNSGGSLTVIEGPMFAGKTEELLRKAKTLETIGGKKVLLVKTTVDDRGGEGKESIVIGHDGTERAAFLVGNSEGGFSAIIRKVIEDNIDAVIFDEGQFFFDENCPPDKFIETVGRLVQMGKIVIVACLDFDFRPLPFTITATLRSIPGAIIMTLPAICERCGGMAPYTQRLVDEKPAKFNAPPRLIGGKECYEPRCKNCHEAAKHCSSDDLLVGNLFDQVN